MVWCLWCLSRQSLFMASFIIFRTVWLRWFILLARSRCFLPRYSYSTLSQHISSSGSAYAYAGVCINPAVGFLTGWILLLDYLLFPTLVAVLGGVAVHAILPQIPVWVWAVDLCGYWHRSQLSRDTANGEIR